MSVVIIVVVIGIAMAALQKVRASSGSARCLTNMRQLALLIQQYAADNDGDLLPARVWNGERPEPGTAGPATAMPWNAILHEKGYLLYSSYDGISDSVMDCPAREIVAGSAYNSLHYGMNWFPSFANEGYRGEAYRKMYEIVNPSKTMLLGEVNRFYMISYNQLDRYVAFPHEGRNNVIFMDGHAEMTAVPWTMPRAGDSYPFY